MAEFSAHVPGTFSWAELATPLPDLENRARWILQDRHSARVHDVEPGALCWSELTTRETKAAESFYTQMFGWTAKHSAPSTLMEYTEFQNKGQSGAGMMAMPAHMPAAVPSYWMPYFQVADCDASTARATGLGASVMVPPHDIPKTGRFAILRDAQGAIFGVFKFTGA